MIILIPQYKKKKMTNIEQQEKEVTIEIRKNISEIKGTNKRVLITISYPNKIYLTLLQLNFIVQVDRQ